jgi:phage terminase Nu1 subunit (DNA packaging protein)
MSQRELTKAQLTDRFGESAKQIERYVKAGIPCAGTGRALRFPWPEVRNWRDERLKRMEREATERKLRPASDDEVKQARNRGAIAEAKLLEIELAEKEGRLVLAEHASQIAGEIADRIRAVLINMPSTYLLHLERLGIAPEPAQGALEEIAAALTVALRGTADDLEADDSEEAA